MPSHTFTRLGYWQESIDTNRLSAAAARRQNNPFEELHASDYMEYACLQLGRFDDARRVRDEAAALESRISRTAQQGAAPPTAGAFAAAAIPARYALERSAWAEAAALEVRPSGVPYADAITWFARAVGAARSKDGALLPDAQRSIDRLGSIAAQLSASGELYWADQVGIQQLAASAWLALARNVPDKAVSLMRQAAAREDRTEKSAVTPGPLAPAHEMMGEMLLELKRPSEALVEFRKTMKSEPNRRRAKQGADAAMRLRRLP
jgi:tetratricopeptide (TPR) repeat protein